MQSKTYKNQYYIYHIAQIFITICSVDVQIFDRIRLLVLICLEMLWKCLISSKISLSNSRRSNMKVRVGQFTFFQIRYPTKLKKWTEIRISTVDPLRILEKFSSLFSQESGQKVGHQLTLQMVIIKYHIYMVLFYILNRLPYFVTLVQSVYTEVRLASTRGSVRSYVVQLGFLSYFYEVL